MGNTDYKNRRHKSQCTPFSVDPVRVADYYYYYYLLQLSFHSVAVVLNSSTDKTNKNKYT